jgi:hypothetical protein
LYVGDIIRYNAQKVEDVCSPAIASIASLQLMTIDTDDFPSRSISTEREEIQIDNFEPVPSSSPTELSQVGGNEQNKRDVKYFLKHHSMVSKIVRALPWTMIPFLFAMFIWVQGNKKRNILLSLKICFLVT